MNQCSSHLAKDLRQGLSSCFTFLNSSSEILSAMAEQRHRHDEVAQTLEGEKGRQLNR